MMLFCCRTCAGGPCELRSFEATGPYACPFDLDDTPRWHEIPSGRSTMPRTGRDLLPGPFVELPPRAIARAVAEAGRYTVEIGGVDRLEIEVSRAAFNEAVTAMEAVGDDAAL